MAEEHQLIDTIGERDRAAQQERLPIVPEGGVDLLPPVVDNIDPLPGSSIFPNTPINLDVTDETSLAYHAVFAFYPANGDYDVVHDGDVFATSYAGSSRVIIPNGFRYTLKRRGGWPSSPTFKAIAIDGGGNRAT